MHGHFFINARRLAVSTQIRLSCREDIGLIGLSPGNNQPSRYICPCLLAKHHQSRKWSSNASDNIAYLSCPPLPCSTMSVMRLLSISLTFSETTSRTRSPAPYATAYVALYFGCAAQAINALTTSRFNTTGKLRAT